MQAPKSNLSCWLIFILINFQYQHSWTIAIKQYGDRCVSDHECQTGDHNLICFKSDIPICKCRRSYVWILEKRKCFPTISDNMYKENFEPVRDLIIPCLIVMTVTAMVYLGFKLFCNCGRLMRRRRHQEIARELAEFRSGSQQAWITSYRVISPYGTSTRSPSALSTGSFPLDPTTCMSLFLSSQSIPRSPPSYEEALKHKVILSSYNSPGNPAVSAITLDDPSRYQALPRNPSTLSSSFIFNPNPSNNPSLKNTGQRPASSAVSNNYERMAADWSFIPFPGTPGWEQCTSPTRRLRDLRSTREGPRRMAARHSRVPPVNASTPHTRNRYVLTSQPRSARLRPGQARKIHGNGPSVHLRNGNHNN